MTIKVKKMYAEIFQFLEENKGKKVATLLPQLGEMMASKASGIGGKNFIKDADGKVTHIFCYYHKQWEEVSCAEYGAKVSSATGLNTMCKEGVSLWSKQQRTKKTAEGELIERLAKGTLLPEDIGTAMEQIAQEAKLIVPRSDGHLVEEAELPDFS